MNSNPDKNEFRKYAVKHHRISSTYVDRFIGGVNRSNAPQGIVTGAGITGMTPYIIEERQLNVAQMDVFSRLMMDRIIFLGDAIYDNIANIIQAQLLFLQSADSKRDIQIYINSPGGSVYAGLGIYDTMQFISNDVATICTGMAASMGAVLLVAGTKGKRARFTTCKGNDTPAIRRCTGPAIRYRDHLPRDHQAEKRAVPDHCRP
jgi:ATP-dependent Clp protease protease subunit